CTENPSGVDLEWQLGEPDYDAIEVYFDGVLLEVLSGQAVGFFHDGVLPGLHQWEIVALRSSLESRATPCSIDVTGGGGGPIFLRGDANEDLSLNVADAIFILGYLFIQGPSGSCLDAMDVNDSGSVNIADAVRILLFLFSAGVPPELPWPTPGEDPTADSLPCS
ncbi:MAG: dockerin type I repeat-containing protein, partial [Planctomycetota bacterium]